MMTFSQEGFEVELCAVQRYCVIPDEGQDEADNLIQRLANLYVGSDS